MAARKKKLKPNRFKSKSRKKSSITFNRSTKRDQCAAAIMDTLSYRAVFKYPVTYHQLYTYLITSKRVDPTVFKAELRLLCKRKKVKIKDGRYYFPGINPVNWSNRLTNSENLLKKIDPTLQLLKTIPWIQMVGITGSVAACNAPKNDDIDLFIITKKNRIWLSRFFVVLLTKSVGKYPSKKGAAGCICPNIFVSEDNLAWHKDGRNIYVAHNVLMMRPIFFKDEMYFRFVKANAWVFDSFRNFDFTYSIKERKFSRESKLINLLEVVLMKVQFAYMKKKRTHEVTEKEKIHFNKVDHSNRVLKKFKSS